MNDLGEAMKNRKLFIRIVAIVLAAVMVAGVGYMTVEMLILG